MDPRQHLQALQSQVAAARAAFNAGDRTKALQHLDQALLIDPSFLAAQSLRERVLALPLAPVSGVAPVAPVAPVSPVAPVARVTPSRPPSPLPTRRLAPKEAFERIELRARQRRVDHCIAATRAALGRQQPEAAAAALAELIALEPDESNVASLSAELADLRRRFARRPFGVRLAAAAAFLAVAGTTSWRERPRNLTPVVHVTTAPVRAPEPAADAAPRIAANDGLQSRVLMAPTPVPLPSVAPSRPTPVSAPARPVSPPVTAPLSLPTPLSQLPPAASVTAHEPPAATIATAAPVVEPVPIPIRPPSDRELVEDALQRYRRAYGRLNVQSAQAVYPTVNRVALARAFDGLESQALTFDSCDVDVRGILARAICHGTAHYVPKIGSRYPRTEPLVWSFELRKSDSDWTIYSAKASR